MMLNPSAPAAADLPLCPYLYCRLQELSRGGVVLANQGEAMFSTRHFNQATLRWHTCVHSSGEYYRINCPYCGDTRHRLWVNHRFGQLDANGQRMFYLATCYNENCLSQSDNCRDFIDAVCGFRNSRERRAGCAIWPVNEGATDTGALGPVELPGRVFPLHQFSPEFVNNPAFMYMVERRRYTLEMLRTYQIGLCTEADPRYPLAQDRVVFPIFMENVLVGWQCRYPDDLNWRTAGIPKYYGRPGMSKRLMLYNYDRARHQPYVVVVEGVADVHRIGDTAVAVLGKTVSSPQQQLLLSAWAGKPIILMFDPDAREEMRGAVRDLTSNGRSPVIEAVLPPGPDPGDWDAAALRSFIHLRAREAGVHLPA